MALILSIETATSICSVALHDDEKLLGSEHLHQEKSHAKHLAVLIADLLDQHNISTDDLAAIAVSGGPGSYTGLRIGISTAKGMGFASDLPLIGVNTLEVMADQARQHSTGNHQLCPMIDARRMEVYCALYDHALNVIMPVQAVIIDENSFEKELKDNPILFLGDGMPKCRPLLEKHKNAFFAENIHPSAESVGFLAFKKFKKEEFENTNSFEPYYLKEFMATKPRKLI